MADLDLNSNFSVHLDDRNDLAAVDGREAFEQSVAMMLTDFMYNAVPGLASRDTIEEKIRLQVNRVVREHGLIEEVEDIQVTEKVGSPDTYEVNVSYTETDGIDFSETIAAQ